jgi:hypothetical protein
MSTKSHIFYVNGIEVYEETSEPQSIFGNFQGFNLYFIVEPNFIKSFKIKGDYLFLEVISNELPQSKFKIWGGDILEIDYDSDGLLVIIKGGSQTEKRIYAKDLISFNF